MVAALLFARAGVRTTVIEKHADFLRDFRGDTVHPSTLTRSRWGEGVEAAPETTLYPPPGVSVPLVGAGGMGRSPCGLGFQAMR